MATHESTSSARHDERQALEQDIELTRARLGRTTDQLAEKMDVKAQARRHAPVLAAGLAALAATVAVVIWRKK